MRSIFHQNICLILVTNISLLWFTHPDSKHGPQRHSDQVSNHQSEKSSFISYNPLSCRRHNWGSNDVELIVHWAIDRTCHCRRRLLPPSSPPTANILARLSRPQFPTLSVSHYSRNEALSKFSIWIKCNFIGFYGKQHLLGFVWKMNLHDDLKFDQYFSIQSLVRYRSFPDTLRQGRAAKLRKQLRKKTHIE